MPLAALLLLSTGSLLLLPGPVVWLAGGDTWAFSFSGVGAFFLFLGWAKLGVDISEAPKDTGAHPNLRRVSMWMVYAISGTAFVIGTVSLSGRFAIPPPPQVLPELLPGILLYVPSIYVPVVLGQATILLVGTEYLARLRGRLVSLIGISILFAISSIAIAAQFQGVPVAGILLLAGTTSLGYILVALAWLLYGTPSASTDRGTRLDRWADVGDTVRGSMNWWRWGKRRNGWAALIPGILLLLVSYLLSTFRVWVRESGMYVHPFAAEGLGLLGVGAFLIILGLVLFASS